MMQPIQLRPLGEADLPSVSQIEQAVQYAPWSESMFHDCLAPRYHAQVAEDATGVIGFFIIDSVLDEGTLHNIAVLPDYQGQGVGRRLLTAAIHWAEQQLLVSIFLEVRASNLAACKLYEKFGFQHIGTRKAYYPTASGREDALVMQLALPGSSLGTDCDNR